MDAASDSGNYDSSSDLIGFWKMSEQTGTTVDDSSSNSLTASFHDSPTWVNEL